MRAQWQSEKDSIGKLRALREQIEETRKELEKAEREGNLARAAELKYGKIRELELELKKRETELSTRRPRASSCARR
jgi:ATP-dependent Clp protease ATP-binding subunit ClpB